MNGKEYRSFKVGGKEYGKIKIPDQALFNLREAAAFLGLSPDTLRVDSDEGLVPCYEFHGRRTFKLEDLENLRALLPDWHNERRPITASSERIVDGEQ